MAIASLCNMDPAESNAVACVRPNALQLLQQTAACSRQSIKTCNVYNAGMVTMTHHMQVHVHAQRDGALADKNNSRNCASFNSCMNDDATVYVMNDKQHQKLKTPANV